MPPGKFTYEYPRPAVTVDIAIVTREEKPRVLLIRRKHDPFAGCWALPGGFVDMDEALEAAARRELFEETGVKAKALMQLATFGDPGRDPRGRTISVVYLAEVDADGLQPRALPTMPRKSAGSRSLGRRSWRLITRRFSPARANT